jgi:hypothetical protein
MSFNDRLKSCDIQFKTEEIVVESNLSKLFYDYDTGKAPKEIKVNEVLKVIPKTCHIDAIAGYYKRLKSSFPQTDWKDCTFKDAEYWGKLENYPVFKIRNLTASEISLTNEALQLAKSERFRNLAGLVREGNLADVTYTAIMSVLQTYGVDKDTPDDTIRRINILKYGTVEPVLSHEECVKIGRHYGYDFKNITDRIIMLSHMGSDLGE